MQLDAAFPLTPALSLRRGRMGGSLKQGEPTGESDRDEWKKQKRGRRCALPPHSKGIDRIVPAEGEGAPSDDSDWTNRLVTVTAVG
jgi:hypothetical protein